MDGRAGENVFYGLAVVQSAREPAVVGRCRALRTPQHQRSNGARSRGYETRGDPGTAEPVDDRVSAGPFEPGAAWSDCESPRAFENDNNPLSTDC